MVVPAGSKCVMASCRCAEEAAIIMVQKSKPSSIHHAHTAAVGAAAEPPTRTPTSHVDQLHVCWPCVAGEGILSLQLQVAAVTSRGTIMRALCGPSLAQDTCCRLLFGLGLSTLAACLEELVEQLSV